MRKELTKKAKEIVRNLVKVLREYEYKIKQVKDDVAERNKVMENLFMEIGYAVAYMSQEDWDSIVSNRSQDEAGAAYRLATISRYCGTSYLASEIMGSFLYSRKWPHSVHQEWEQFLHISEQYPHVGLPAQLIDALENGDIGTVDDLTGGTYPLPA